MADKTFILSRDGKEIFKGSADACYAKLHDVCPASWEHALTYEGYSIEETTTVGYLKTLPIADFVKAVTVYGKGEKLKTSRPKNGIHAYVWRMLRFNSGADVTMPMNCYFYLSIELEKATGNKYLFGIIKEEEREILDYLDEVVEEVNKYIGLDLNKAAVKWGKALGKI